MVLKTVLIETNKSKKLSNQLFDLIDKTLKVYGAELGNSELSFSDSEAFWIKLVKLILLVSCCRGSSKTTKPVWSSIKV